MTFGERLTELRIEKGYKKRNEFADKLGIPSTTLRNYETDVREPGHTFLKQISDFFNVSVDYLLCLTDERERIFPYQLKASEFDHIKKYRALDDHGREHVNNILEWEIERVQVLTEKARLLSSLQNQLTTLKFQARLRLYTYMGKIACAGTGFYFDDIPTDTIEAPYRKGADFIIGVSGDSMEPNYHDGEKLYVQKTRELTLGDVGIFTIHNECFVKELGERGLNSLHSFHSFCTTPVLSLQLYRLLLAQIHSCIFD